MSSSTHNQSGLQPLVDQVEDVKGIMSNNIEKALEREGKINELDTRADQLREKATQFNTTAIKVNRKMWWENTKMKIIIGVSVGVLLLTILMIVLWQLGVFSSSSSA